MANIPLSKFVDISSVRQSGAAVPRREFVARIMTNSEFIQTGGVTSFSSLEEVATLFDTTSEEYRRAQFNFGFISRLATSPRRFELARWVENDVEAKIFGSRDTKNLGDFTSISDGSMVLVIAGVSRSLTGLDFTGDASLSAVATTLQTAITASGGSQFTGATVVYNALTNSFDFTSGDTGAATIAVFEGGSGTPVAALFGWTDLTTVVSDGAVAQTPVDAVSGSADVSNNFGSVGFLDSLNWNLTQVTEIANWIHSENVSYQFHVPVTEANALSYSNALTNLSGTGLTIQFSGTGNEYHEMMPMVLLASTPYERANASQNYMYTQAALTPTITDNVTANQLDALRVNYYGRTKVNGVAQDFYQRGYLQGGDTAPINMNIFANEQWFKDAIATSILSLQISQGISADDDGLAATNGVITGNIEQAKENGTITVGRDLNDVQIQLIGSITGDPLAYQDVEATGYWLQLSLVQRTVNGIPEWEIDYILVYLADAVVRKVNGSHTLLT